MIMIVPRSPRARCGVQSRKQARKTATVARIRDLPEPHLERIAAQIVAVQFDQIEGIEEHAGVMPAVTNAIEARHPIGIASDSFAIDDAGARAQLGQSLHNQREAISQIIAWATVEPHAVAILAADDAKTVVLDLVQPLAA
jgi:hypothetical protein